MRCQFNYINYNAELVPQKRIYNLISQKNHGKRESNHERRKKVQH